MIPKSETSILIPMIILGLRSAALSGIILTHYSIMENFPVDTRAFVIGHSNIQARLVSIISPIYAEMVADPSLYVFYVAAAMLCAFPLLPEKPKHAYLKEDEIKNISEDEAEEDDSEEYIKLRGTGLTKDEQTPLI
jgi:hypothetical protein